jgi:hypothetical protein
MDPPRPFSAVSSAFGFKVSKKAEKNPGKYSIWHGYQKTQNFKQISNKLKNIS